MLTAKDEVRSLNVHREVQIDAPLDASFEAVLAEMGPASEMPDGTPFPMVLEAWPGGRWYRDLGDDRGHLWGHVQVIKPPTLIEICGPMFMSYPAVGHLQYRLSEEGGGTRLKLTHRAMGLIPPDHIDGVQEGWEYKMGRVKALAERMASARSERR